MLAVYATGMIACSGSLSVANNEVLVFAAASLRDVLEDVGTAFERASGVSTVFNFAGSNTLARQIEASPIADVFVSADERWMDYIAALNLVTPGTRRTLLGNRLVVVAHSGSCLRLEKIADLTNADIGFLSLGDPDAVPAGRYAKEMLQRLRIGTTDLWSQIHHLVVPAPDVRAALALVEARPDVMGIVYRTDALTSSRVKIVLELADTGGPMIRYAIAGIGKQPTATTRRWLDFLRGDLAQEAFERHGFVTFGSD